MLNILKKECHRHVHKLYSGLAQKQMRFLRYVGELPGISHVHLVRSSKATITSIHRL